MRLLPLLFLLLSLPVATAQTVTITGQSPTAYYSGSVYLDVLDVPLGVVMIADHQILARTEVDSSGKFAFPALPLAQQPCFYRIRYGMPGEGAVHMDFRHRHFLTIVIDGQAQLTVDSLTLRSPSPLNAQLLAVQHHLDQWPGEQPATTERQETLVDDLRTRYLRERLHATDTDPYVAVFLAGMLFWELATLDDLTTAQAAIARTDLPSSYRIAIEQRIGSLLYVGLEQENRWLRAALVLTGLLCMVLGVLYWRRRSVVPPANTPDPVTDLSPKEREVADLIAAGRSNKEVAAELYVSVSTIKTHVNSIYRKLSISSRRELVDTWEEHDSTPA